MIRDTSLVLQIQVALIGIVVVIGLFYVWRNMVRMEEKLDKYMEESTIGKCMCAAGNTCGYQEPTPQEDDAAAEEFMKHVFGDNAMMFMTMPPNACETTAHVVEEAPAAAEPPVTVSVPEDHESVTDTDVANPLSKSKLRRMSAEALVEMCRERGLPFEGTKTVLVDRLLGLQRE